MLTFFEGIVSIRWGNIYNFACRVIAIFNSIVFFQSCQFEKNGSSSTAGVMIWHQREQYIYHKANPSNKLPWIWRHQVSFLPKKGCHLINHPWVGDGRFQKTNDPISPWSKKTRMFLVRRLWSFGLWQQLFEWSLPAEPDGFPSVIKMAGCFNGMMRTPSLYE